MEVVKKTKDYSILKKRSGKFGVKGNDGKWINGDEKAKILIGAKLVKTEMPKPVAKKEKPVEEAPVEEAKEE